MQAAIKTPLPNAAPRVFGPNPLIGNCMRIANGMLYAALMLKVGAENPDWEKESRHG
jgi:hypothetical protein